MQNLDLSGEATAQLGRIPNGAFFLPMPSPVSSNAAQGDAYSPLSHSSWSNNLLLPKDMSRSPFHQENCHCPTHPTENGSDPFRRQSQTHQRDTQPGQAPYSSQDLVLNPERILSPSSFHGCNSVIPLCKSGINVLTLLRLFCSNSGLNAVRISLTYVCFQSGAINLWEQQLTPRPTAKIPADGTKAGSAVAMPCPATGTGR